MAEKDWTNAKPAERLAALESLGLSVASVFVPFSKSRNATPRNGSKTPWLSLNWKVTLHHNGRAIMSDFDYSQGSGHCPAERRAKRLENEAAGSFRHRKAMAIQIEIETGRVVQNLASTSYMSASQVRIPGPALLDVFYSLASDAAVLDYPDFESWAADMGIDPDSRSGESTYRACLETALRLRAMLGETVFSQAREITNGF